MEEGLKLVISADASEAVKAFSDTKNAAQSAANAFKGATPQFTNSQNQIVQAANRVNTALSNVKKPSGEATQSLINLSRVAQDAPYGFIGIANNINPLLESLQRLKASTGSTGAAIKALGSEMLGAGGLGLAVGIVSSLLVVFGDKLFGTGRSAKSAKESLDDYVDSLNDVDQARVKGLQTAQEELVKLQTLYGATQNANIPLAERKKLVDELQDQYPKYFKNISDETILAGGAKKAYDELAGAIIAAAKARAAQDQLVEIQKQVLAIDEKIANNLKEQEKARARSADAQKSIGLVTGGGTAQAVNIDNREVIAKRDLNKVVSAGNDLLKQRNELNERANKLAQFAQQTVQANPNSLLNPTGNLPKDDAPKKQKDANKELEKALQEKKDILTEFQKDFEVLKLPLPNLSKSLEEFKADELTKELNDKLNKALLQQPLKLQLPKVEVQGIDLKNPPRPLKIQQSIDVDLQLSEDFQKKMKSFVEGFNNTIKDAIVNGIAGFAEGIGQALVGGDFSQVFKNIAGVMGDLLEQLGKMLIKEAVQIQVFKEALYKWAIANPALAIAAGAGLIIAGAAIKKAVLPQPKKFATGGDVFGSGIGDTVPALLTPGEYVLTTKEAPIWKSLKGMFGLGGFNTGVPKTLPFHFATGGTVPSINNLNFSQQPRTIAMPAGEWVIRGKDLVYAIAETNKMLGRSF